jgi:FtsZ-binding cell division protein ZapB
MAEQATASPLEAAIQDLIQKSTFSVDALAGIQALKEKARQLTSELDQARREIQRLSPEAQQAKESKVLAQDALNKLGLSINKQQELDTAKQVAVARAETYKECFELVFRNTEVRTKAIGSISFPGENGCYPQSGPTSEEKTTEIK